MNYKMIPVPIEKKHVLRNMLELYFHDMSEFDDETDPLDLDESGLFGYRWLDYYWTEAGRYAYIAEIDGKIAGFVMVRTIDPDERHMEIAEFFVMRKYRRSGIGTYMMSFIFGVHKGKWSINTPIKNKAAQAFWKKNIEQGASGRIYEMIIENGRRLNWDFIVK